MANHPPISADPEQIHRAEEMWGRVTCVAKWSVLAITLLLGGLGAIFIHW